MAAVEVVDHTVYCSNRIDCAALLAVARHFSYFRTVIQGMLQLELHAYQSLQARTKPQKANKRAAPAILANAQSMPARLELDGGAIEHH